MYGKNRYLKPSSNGDCQTPPSWGMNLVCISSPRNPGVSNLNKTTKNKTEGGKGGAKKKMEYGMYDNY